MLYKFRFGLVDGDFALIVYIATADQYHYYVKRGFQKLRQDQREK